MVSRKIVAPLLTLLLVAGVATALYMSASEQMTAMALTEVRGVSGSEKLPFFHDPRTVEALGKEPHRLAARVEKAGSRQIATSFDLSHYDFAFPAGVPAAEKLRREHGITKSYQVFFTPMVIASWRPVAELLIANGIVERRDGVHYIIDLRRLFGLIRAGRRWNELEGSEAFPANKSILVTTTDVRKSNSAAMFLALASYVYNGDAIVQDAAQAEAIVDELAELFLRQGFTENSSAAPFQDYLTMGPGKTPMVMIYEAQFLYEKAKPESAIRDEMVLLYPEPTLFTKHVLVPLSEAGERLGEALAHDPALQRIATDHGLHTDDVQQFREFVQRHRLEVPEFLVNVIEPPSYEVLEGMIAHIEARYGGE